MKVTPGRLRALRIGAFLAVTGALVFALRRFNWAKLLSVIAGVRWPWLALGLLANTSIIVFWGFYWRTLLPKRERVSYRNMLQIGAIASSVMNSVPFGAGHATGFALLMSRGGVSSEAAAAVMTLDQLGEGVIKVLIFLLAASFAPLPDWMRKGVLGVSAGVGLLLVALVIAAYGAPHPGSTHAQKHAERENWWSKAWTFVIKISHSLDVLRDWRQASEAFLAVAAMKGAELFAIIAVQRSLGLDLPIGGCLVVLAAVVLATMLPIAPGNFGAYEAAVYLAYTALGQPAESALGLALVQHACFLIPSAGIGYLFVAKDAVVPAFQERRKKNRGAGG